MKIKNHEKQQASYLIDAEEIYNDLEVSEQQIAEGNTKDAWGSLITMREKYDL